MRYLQELHDFDDDHVNHVYESYLENDYELDIEPIFNPPDEEDSVNMKEVLTYYTPEQLQKFRESYGYDEVDTVIGMIDVKNEHMDSHNRYVFPLTKDQYVPIKIGKKIFMSSVDTGAGLNLIDARALQGLTSARVTDLKRKPTFRRFGRPVTFMTVSEDGQDVVGIGTAEIEFWIGDLKFLRTFHVVEGIRVDVILGREFMKSSGVVINYVTNTITLSPSDSLYTIQYITIPPRAEEEVLTGIGNPLKEAPLEVEREVEENGAGHSSQFSKYDQSQTRRVTIFNDTEEQVILPPGMDVSRNHLTTMRDNVLQNLNEVLEWNRSMLISEMEGVTHGSDHYWAAINQINLDNSILDASEREVLFDAIFRQRGALSLYGQIGKLKHFFYDIKLKDTKVYNKESYRMNPVTRQIMQGKIDELMQNGIAQKHMSQYSSPALLVKKPSSKGETDPFKAKYRLVIDLREMNANAIHLQYSLPVIHEVITQLDPTRKCYFSLLDLSDAFYQIQLHRKCYDYTTFKVGGIGSFCLTRLPQGYVGAPSIFQAVIENLFPEHIRQYLTCYIDDILIMTETAVQHLKVVELVLYTLRQNGMKLKIEKCNICPPELDFLGVTLCREGIKVKTDKVEAIAKLDVPVTKKQVRSFLGAVGYYRRYIQHFAQIAKPLHELTRDEIPNQKVPWDERCQESFNTLKRKLMEAPILGHIDYSRPIVLRTDASGVGIGSTLLQLDGNNEVVIAYYSRVLQPHEYNYDITTREALAVLSSVRHFATYLRFVEDYTIQTDHLDLKYVFKKESASKQESHRLIRWALYLNGFPGYIQFTSGSSPKIRIADFLSRHQYEDQNEELGRIAREIDIRDLEKLEANCADCNVDVYEKIAERKRTIVPDIEQLRQQDEGKYIGRIEVTCAEIQRVPYSLVDPTQFDYTKEGESNETYLSKRPQPQECEVISADNETFNEGLDDLNENETMQNEPIEQENELSFLPAELPFPEEEYWDEGQNEQDYLSPGIGNSQSILIEDFEEFENRHDQYQVPLEDVQYQRIEELRENIDDYEYQIFPRDQLREMQLSDMLTGSLISYIENDDLPPEKRKAQRIIMMADSCFLDNVDGILFHVEYPAGGLVKDYCLTQLFVPDSLVSYLLQEVHTPMHLGRTGMMAQIRQKYYFPKMNAQIERYIQNCNICQLQKRMRRPYRAPLKTRKLLTQPGEVWYLDHMGPIKFKQREDPDSFKVSPTEESSDLTSKDNYTYVLIAVDSYSLYVELILCKGTTAAETADLLFKNIVCRHSWPKAWVHDQGTAFVNKILEWFSDRTGIKNYQTASMNPRSNGLAESRVKIVSVALAKLVNERRGEWYDYIPSIQFAMNCVPSQANCIPPFVLQHGRWPNDPLSLALLEEEAELSSHVEYCSKMISRVRIWRNVAKQCRRRYDKKMAKEFENQVRIPDEIRKGEMCYLFVPYLDTKTKGIRRLNIPWKGPFAISDIKDNRLVKLIRVSDFTESDKWYPIHRIKVTKYGLDPPKFEYVEGITVEHDEDREINPELIADDFVNQPFDNNATVEAEREEEMIRDQEKANEIIDKMKEFRGKLQERDEQRSQEIMESLRKRIPSILLKTTMSPRKVNPRKPLEILYKVKLPPRIRTTRQAPATNEPTYKNVARILKYKVRRDGTEQAQIICEGDPVGYEMWVTLTQIMPIDDKPEMHDKLKKDLEDLKTKSEVSNKYY